MNNETAFHCPYAEIGYDRCPEWRCDCFIDTHPDSPLDLHPEDFAIEDFTFFVPNWAKTND